MAAHSWRHSVVILSGEGRQFSLLRHKSRRNVRAVTGAVEVVRGVMSIVQAELTETEAVVESRIRRWVQHGRRMSVDVEIVESLHVRGIVSRRNVRQIV